MINFDYVSEHPTGVVSHCFLQELDRHLSTNEALQSFISKFASTKKWFLISDYCLGDPNKPNDCVSFSLIPHVSEVSMLLDGMDKASKSDVKSVRKVSPDFIRLLSRYPVFNISFILNRDRRLAPDERQFFQAKIRALRRQIDVWNETTPAGIAFTKQFSKKLARMELVVRSKGANFRLMRDVEIIATIAGCLASALSVPDTTLVTWLSDRDSILSYLKTKRDYPLAFDLALTLHHTLCLAKNKDPDNVMAFGVPEESGAMWYDALVRIPDLICGTMADYDTKTDEITHEKFIPVLRELFVNREKNIFYRLTIQNNGCHFSQVEFNLTKERASARGA